MFTDGRSTTSPTGSPVTATTPPTWFRKSFCACEKGLDSYQPGSFEGWLWRITRNAFLDEVRRRKRRPTAPLPDEVDRWDLASSPSADVEYSRISIGDDVQKALLELPYEFREAVVLCDVVGLSYEEIARAVAVPVGTVRSRIHRGRKLMRESLT